MVVLGHENTLAVTVDEMLHHTRAVRRAVRRALVVADMPFGSYHGTVAEGVANAVRFIKEAARKRSRSRARASSWCARSPRPRFPSSAIWD
jgi:3-methyl-2-oxobutanoate hydroxymethyltransferase